MNLYDIALLCFLTVAIPIVMIGGALLALMVYTAATKKD